MNEEIENQMKKVMENLGTLTEELDGLERLHTRLHDWYGYLVFLLHVPFHLLHKSEGYPDYSLFTLKGSIYCECGYFYDRGYYLLDCRRCYS